MKYVALITGGFDPIHEGHIEMFKVAHNSASHMVSESFDEFAGIIVGLNSDEWLIKKKGYVFQNFQARQAIIRQLKEVISVFPFPDDDEGTASGAIEIAKECFPDCRIVFCNGGDRSTVEENPEYVKYKDDHRLRWAFAVGGADKKNSSSEIVDDVIPMLKEMEMEREQYEK